MIRKRGRKVPPLSIKGIRDLAFKLRQTFSILGVDLKGKVDIVHIIDCVIPKILPEFTLDIVPDDELGEDHAQTLPDKLNIKVKESVYEGACKGVGRDLFTLAHELGHLFIHRNVSSYARTNKVRKHKPFEDSEWQADCFAAEFLMLHGEVMACKSVNEVKNKFGVSYTAAEVRFNKVKR